MRAEIITGLFHVIRATANKVRRLESGTAKAAVDAISRAHEADLANADARLAYAKDFLAREEQAAAFDVKRANERRERLSDRIPYFF